MNRVLPLLGLLLGLATRLPAGDGVAAPGAWWAVQPLKATPPPGVPELHAEAPHPVDAFILAGLAKAGLTPAPVAERRALIRRVSFDLVGLPPTPAEVAAFVDDPSPRAYEQLVDRLLASPRYGERWARHWMDAVHFAETHGHDQDRIRTNAWPYRDYLIASFNADKPYPRFLQEQVAGDVLFPSDPAATVALGFLAAGPWDESSLRDIREDALDRQIGRYLDRDDVVTTVMQTFASVTVQCARCHDHKFDPISQQDYYALQAVFAGVDRANRPFDPDPGVHARRRELRQRLAAVERGDPEVLTSPETVDAVRQWEARRPESTGAWSVFHPDVYMSAAGAAFTRQPDGSLLASGPHGPTDVYTFSGPSPVPRVTALRLEVLPDPSLPQGGPGRESNGNLHLSEIQLQVFEPGQAATRVIGLRNPSSDFDQAGWTVAHALDGNEKSAWGIHPNEGARHVAVFELATPWEVPPGARLAVVLKQLHGGHCIGRPRLSVSGVDPASALAAVPSAVERVLGVPPSQRSAADQAALAAHVLRQRLTRELALLPAPSLVYAAASDFDPDGGLRPAGGPRTVHVLRRGEVTKPAEVAQPGTLSCVAGLGARFQLEKPADEGLRRAALARWLADPGNPLTWRSIVNRVWQHHFGRGLVETVNDFGRMGRAPSHPALLDWLAVWFRDQAHGSMKALHRLLVTSATYRQSSAAAGTADPDNEQLARMVATRLDAEQVRDAVLQVAGRLDLRMGGPSDRQFELQPGIHVTPRVDYSKFDVDEAAGRRRGVYRFLFRTLPDPFMDALDCPAGDQLTPVRSASVTVQQALALWNDAFVARNAEHFASRLEREAGSMEGRVRLAFELVYGRSATPDEVRECAGYGARHGLANLGRLLFNSNEFMFIP
jgi:hypothetical protein